MFGTKLSLITPKWEDKGYIRCKVLPRKGEYIYLSEFDKYVVVVNVIHQTTFWSTKMVAIVDEITINLTSNGKRIEK